jgi:hypothetical protein
MCTINGGWLSHEMTVFPNRCIKIYIVCEKKLVNSGYADYQ